MLQAIIAMRIQDKVTEFIFMADEFCKVFDAMFKICAKASSVGTTSNNYPLMLYHRLIQRLNLF